MKNHNEKALVEIKDKDIATIEALHDLLLDKHGYDLNHVTLKRARKLSFKMYSAMGYNVTEK